MNAPAGIHRGRQTTTIPPLLSSPSITERGESTSALKRATGFWWLCWLAAALSATGVLYLFNPVESRFYPSCLFYQSTGLLCPGCGTLRAGFNLLHGHFIRALQCNCLAILAAFGAAGLAIWAIARRVMNRPAAILIRPPWLWALCGVIIAFGIVRNLPLNPAWIQWLRPPA